MRTLLVFLLACATHVHAQGKPRILETFQVGPTVYVRALAVEPARNVLWVGTSTGMHEVDLGSGALRATFTRREGLASEQVLAIAIDAQGAKWIGTASGGASRLKDGAWKTYFPLHGLADYRVSGFAADGKGGLWMATLGGASRFDRKSGRFTNYTKELVNAWVYSVAIDDKGRVWFGTEGGVSMFNGKIWRSWTEADGLGSAEAERRNYVFAVYAARDGSIWAGTWGGGAARFDGERWTTLTPKDGLAGAIVYAIAEDERGALWFGTDAGLSRYEGGKFTTLGAKDGLPSPNVYALAPSPRGELWAGMKGSVARIVTR